MVVFLLRKELYHQLRLLQGMEFRILAFIIKEEMGAIEVWGKCTECGDEAEKRLVSRKSSLCLYHFRKVRKGGTGIKPVSEKQQVVLADDQKMYREIWRERKHVSEISGKPLGDKLKPVFFSHILAKGIYPKFRHRKDNIILMTEVEHFTWEFGDRKHPNFDLVKERYQKLLEEYNNVTN